MDKSTRYIARVRFVEEDETTELDIRRQTRTVASAKDYEYMLPPGSTGRENYAVVCTKNGGNVNLQTMKIVRILEIKEATEQQYEGELKPIVAAFSTEGFTEWNERIKKRRALMVQVEKKVSERSKIAQLEALAGDDPEARALLDALKAL